MDFGLSGQRGAINHMESKPQYGASKPDSRPTVYLAGSIDGHACLEDAKTWRDEAAEVLVKAGYKVLDPLRWPADTYQDSGAIMQRNTVDIFMSDIVLTEMDNPAMSYIGTGIDIFQAYQFGREIILWGGANRGSHALKCYAPVRYETLGDALNYLVERIEKSRGAMASDG